MKVALAALTLLPLELTPGTISHGNLQLSGEVSEYFVQTDDARTRFTKMLYANRERIEQSLQHISQVNGEQYTVGRAVMVVFESETGKVERVEHILRGEYCCLICAMDAGREPCEYHEDWTKEFTDISTLTARVVSPESVKPGQHGKKRVIQA